MRLGARQYRNVLFALQTAAAAPYSRSNVELDGGISADDLLSDFNSWLTTTQLPSYDHALLFTKYEHLQVTTFMRLFTSPNWDF